MSRRASAGWSYRPFQRVKLPPEASNIIAPQIKKLPPVPPPLSPEVNDDPSKTAFIEQLQQKWRARQ